MNISAIKECFRNAILDLNIRGLFIASKWASEQLVGMASQEEDECFGEEEITTTKISLNSKREYDIIMFGSSLLQNGEYHRCAHLMRKPISTSGSKTSMSSSSVGQFIASYSLYMAGEKVREQCIVEQDGHAAAERASSSKSNQQCRKSSRDDTKTATTFRKNPYLNDIFRELYPIYCSYVNSSEDKGSLNAINLDGYLMFLFAVVVKGLRAQGGGPRELISDKGPGEQVSSSGEIVVASTMDLFLEAVKMNPWNWSCWLELADVCVNRNAAIPSWDSICEWSTADTISNGKIMYDAFISHVHLERQDGAAALTVIEPMLQVFPNSAIVSSQVALCHYALRDYDRAQFIFEDIRINEPYRLQHMETFSNILYVKEKKAELSHLAHTLVKIDKFSPESCCVIGNYYSLKAQHERAILYFQRAIKLNPSFSSAWTLMGHEFVELRNTSAAVQCYRRAVDVASGDYRAWYGLGQTYEMLHLYQYALYYFKRSAYLKPTDARMWCALGNCFCRLGCVKDAIAAYERAATAGDKEGIATRELARLYKETGQPAKAAESYYKHLQLSGLSLPDFQSNHQMQMEAYEQERCLIDAEKAEGIIYLAGYFRSDGNWPLAGFFCVKLMEYVGPEGDQARALMREMRYYNAAGETKSGLPLDSPRTMQTPSAATPGALGTRSNVSRMGTFPRIGSEMTDTASSILGLNDSIRGREGTSYTHSMFETGLFDDSIQDQSIMSDRRMSMHSAVSSMDGYDARAMGELSMSVEEDGDA